MKIPADAFVLVADGRKALVLRNRGDDVHPNLEVDTTLESPANPATHEQGADRPGRAFASVGEHRSAVGQTDWHAKAEHEFAGEIASLLERRCRAGSIKRLIVVAAPHTLASLRGAFSKGVAECVVAEIDKDFTKHPVYELEKSLAAM
jgi:protein required for attachment to host cells